MDLPAQLERKAAQGLGLGSLSGRLRLALVGAIALAICLCLVGLTRARTTWLDEALYASRAVNWNLLGQTSMAFLEPPPGDDHIFVAYPILLGEFFGLFGVGLLQSRLFGWLCYVVACGAAYGACRGLRLSSAASLLATFIFATDRGVVWLVRSGRPDILPIALLGLGLVGVLFAARARHPVHSAIVMGMAACCYGVALLCHAYAFPWLFLGLAIGAVAQPVTLVSRPLLVGFLLGMAIPMLPYLGYVTDDLETFEQALGAANGFFEAPIVGPTLLGELQRLLRATLVQAFRWLVVLLATPIALRMAGVRARHAVLLATVAVHLLLLYWIVPQNTWYQVAYVALPLALLWGASVDALDAVTASRKRSWLSSLARAGLLGSVIEGFLWLSAYPVISVLQWRERSYAAVRQELSRVIPREVKVAAGFGAYFPILEIGARPVFVDLSPPGFRKSTHQRAEYQRKLAEAGVDFVVLGNGRSTRTLAPELGRALVFVATVGQPKATLPFVRDAAYHFDVYRATRRPPNR